jgi:hypothetical protein
MELVIRSDLTQLSGVGTPVISKPLSLRTEQTFFAEIIENTKLISLDMDRACGTCGRDEKYKIWLENLKKRDHMVELVVEVRIILRSVFVKYFIRGWAGSICLRMETSGGLV